MCDRGAYPYKTVLQLEYKVIIPYLMSMAGGDTFITSINTRATAKRVSFIIMTCIS